MSAPRIVVTTVPFGHISAEPLERLRDAGLHFEINPLGRKLKNSEVAGIIGDHDIVIAGTEVIDADVMNRCPNLKGICRVGIGLDGVDLLEARRRGIAVSYTPDGPSAAVAELTIGLIVDCLRRIGEADRALRGGRWERQVGLRIGDSTIGVIGCGRIGSRVVGHLLGGFPGVRILATDIRADMRFPGSDQVRWVDRDTLLRECDLVTLHTPLNRQTRGIIGEREMSLMRPGACLVNTARGGIVDESALLQALSAGVLGSAAIDVFEEEPYAGPLLGANNAILTCHRGSMTRDCRLRMELEATLEAIRFAAGGIFATPVPEDEYALRSSQ